MNTAVNTKMPYYDFKCGRCGNSTELRTPPSAAWRKCSCGGRAARQFSGSFISLNTTSAAGMRFKGLEHTFGVRPETVNEQAALMDAAGVRPDSEFTYTKGKVERKEITEKELGECLRDVNSLGTI